MTTIKHLITSGCSFSDVINGISWPLHLEKTLSVISNHCGLGSQGNGLIARKALYAVYTALKQGFKPEEILVGIMWSGANRGDIFFQHDLNLSPYKDANGWVKNPSCFVENALGGWLLLNPWWKEPINKIYYSKIHDSLGSVINTYEKILWTQNTLKMLGVNYFMTAFHPDTYAHNEFVGNANLTWLSDQIDLTHWLPITNMTDWTTSIWSDDHFQQVRYNNKLENTDITEVDYHPSRKMNIKFVKDIILPHLNSKLFLVPTTVKEFPAPKDYIDPYDNKTINTFYIDETGISRG